MRVTVRVIPRSSRNIVEWERESGTLKVRLTAPPVDGAANEALIALLAEHFGLPRRTISIVRGATGRQKTLEIQGLTPDMLENETRRGTGLQAQFPAAFRSPALLFMTGIACRGRCQR